MNSYLKIVLIVLCIAFIAVLIIAFIDFCGFIQEAKAGEDWDDIAFDITAFAGEWVPTLRYIQVKDSVDAVVDSVVSIGDSSVTRDTIYASLYEAGGVTTGVAIDSFLVQVLDSSDSPIDTIWVMWEDYDDVYDTNYTPTSYLVQMLDSLDNPVDTISVIDESLHVWVANYFTAPYWVNVKDSLNNVLYSYYASKDSEDVFATNHWEPHYSIAILGSTEVILYTISATQDSPNPYIRNWFGEAPAATKVGVPGTDDYCKITGVVQGPEGTRITNAVVHFRLKSHFPVFWGDVLITQTLWKTTTDDTGGIEFSILRNGDLSDTLSYYSVNVPKAGLRNAKAVIPKDFDELPWQTIFTTQ